MKRRTLILSLVLGLTLAAGVILLAAAPAATAAPDDLVLLVDCTDGVGDVNDLIAVINSANSDPGETIIGLGEECVYTLPAEVEFASGLPRISEDLVIEGNGATIARDPAAGPFRLMMVTNGANLTLQDVTLRDGYTGGYGGAIYHISSGLLTLENVILRDNFAYGGGAVHAFGPVEAVDSRFEDNTASTAGGGAIHGQRALTVRDSALNRNESNDSGGAIHGQSDVVVDGGELKYNRAINGSAGAIYAEGEATVRDVYLRDNDALYHAGGVYAETVTADRVSFHLNESLNGDGGGLYAGDYAHITGSFFFRNTAAGNGGGAFSSRALHTAHSDYRENTAAVGGGAIRALGAASVRYNTFYENEAGAGAALALSQELGGNSFVESNVLFNNTATYELGSALCLLCGLGSSGTVDVIHNTVAADPSSARDAIKVETGTATVANNIIAGHRVGLRNTAADITSANNLYYGNGEDEVGDFAGSAGHVTGEDVRFVNSVQGDYRLQPASPAVDRASDAYPTSVDRRGVPRPQGAAPDIGAYELDRGELSESAITTVECENGTGDPAALINAINNANYYGGAERIELAEGCTYTLTAAGDDYLAGANGLPVVTDYLTIVGLGEGATIRRSETVTESFRLLGAKDASLRVVGLTLENGDGAAGGAVYLEGWRSPGQEVTLDGVTVRGNRSNNSGGGVATYGGRVSALNSHFEGNVADDSGGAFQADDGSVISNTTFISNTAGNRGGGVIAYGGTTVAASTFAGNSAQYKGGALHVSESPLVITGTTFSGNTADEGGGVNASSQITVAGSVFDGNRALRGAALSAVYWDDSLLVNNLFADNEVEQADEAAVRLTGNAPARGAVLHNTFVASQPLNHVALTAGGDDFILTNNVVAGYSNGVLVDEGNVISSYNLFHGVDPSGQTTGTGDLTGDPLFVDAAGGDYRLQADSPAVDSGADAGVHVDTLGAARPQGDGYDRGAYEYEPAGGGDDPPPVEDPPPTDLPYAVYLPAVTR